MKFQRGREREKEKKDEYNALKSVGEKFVVS
jgi:hypothetical protein